MDQISQFFITVGTVIAVFLWLRSDINRLDTKIDRVNDALQGDIESLRGEVAILRGDITSVREEQAWLRGRLDYSRTVSIDSEDD